MVSTLPFFPDLKQFQFASSLLFSSNTLCLEEDEEREKIRKTMQVHRRGGFKIM